MLSAVRFAPLFALSMCGKKDATPDLVWVQFNGDEDVIDVPVTASADLGDAAWIELTSNTGQVVVGDATVEPGSGPVGMSREVTVQVNESFSETVTKVELIADAGDRGVQTLQMEQDRALPGVWFLDLVAQGAPGEVRTDTFTVLLWAAEPEPAKIK